MKSARFFLRVVIVLLSLTAASAYAHNFAEALQMVQGNLAETNLLVLKTRNAQVPARLRAAIPAAFEPVFQRPAADYAREKAEYEARTGEKAPALEAYFYARFSSRQSLEDASEYLRQVYADPEIEFAYFQPRIVDAKIERRRARADAAPADAAVPNYEQKQFYLDPAPRGVDARFAWERTGGDGSNVKVIDIESGWNVKHEDLRGVFWSGGAPLEDNDHGTAVWGEIAAKRDGVGITGIAYGTTFGVSASEWDGDWEAWRKTLVRALDEAIPQLSAGDVLIIEQHAYGPDNSKFTAVEYWQEVFDRVKLASGRGIIVVAAAGNGDSDFDSPNYEGAFDLNVRDSGSILVGAAGSPISNEHLQRLYFSNYGSRVDAFAYGFDVTTTGYGDLYYVTGNPNRDYTDDFGGTSSATPIVTGAVTVLSSIAKAQGRLLEPLEVRAALRATGTPQAGDTSERIGNLPDLKQLMDYLHL